MKSGSITISYFIMRGKMSRFFKALTVLIGLLNTSLISHAQTPPNAPPPFESIEVHNDNRVTFRYYGRNAKEVRLNTQLASGLQPMTKDASGVWSVTLGPVKPDMYPYHFVVDGVQVADPGNSLIFPNEGFQNSIVEITGNTPLVHSVQPVPHGTL